MIAYNCDLNIILACTFNYHKAVHRLGAYNSITEQPQSRGNHVNLQVADFQLVPPIIQRRNAAKHAILTSY